MKVIKELSSRDLESKGLTEKACQAHSNSDYAVVEIEKEWEWGKEYDMALYIGRVDRHNFLSLVTIADLEDTF